MVEALKTYTGTSKIHNTRNRLKQVLRLHERHLMNNELQYLVFHKLVPTLDYPTIAVMKCMTRMVATKRSTPKRDKSIWKLFKIFTTLIKKHYERYSPASKEQRVNLCIFPNFVILILNFQPPQHCIQLH